MARTGHLGHAAMNYKDDLLYPLDSCKEDAEDRCEKLRPEG